MNASAHQTKWTLVARGGHLLPGEHVERFADEAALRNRLAAMRAEAARAGEPLVSHILKPKGITR